ncbi:hypothetical protein [Legionella donaldsonii]|uniref:hypothetical protein n=1 Tax=Legionella donaldsonii TaxID=45060 RepID=UPI00399CA0F1
MSDLTSADFSASVVAALALVLHAQFLLISVADATLASKPTHTFSHFALGNLRLLLHNC